MKPYIYILPLILIISLAISNQAYTQSQGQSNESLDKVLKSYVKEGSVNYSGIQSNPKDLKIYLDQTSIVSKETFDSWNKNDQLAFLINIYNAHTLYLVAQNYPVKSIKDIAVNTGGPWKQPIVELFGDKISLDELEHEVIRKNYPDPRVHFVLVCAALGCPELIDTPYEAQILEQQLEQQTKVFLLDNEKNSIDTHQKVLKLSPIFNWFKEDFILESGTVIEFVNPYFGNQANSEYKIEYTNYDWSIND